MIPRLKDTNLTIRMSFGLFKLLYKKRNFDEFGLRHSSKVLSAMKPKLYLLPLEWLAEFVDAITYGMVLTITQKPFMHEAQVAKDKIVSAISDGPVHYNHINTTGIGNLAYVALYYPHEYIRKEAMTLLENCFKEHIAREEALQ